jgi:hypothetical protein
METERTERKGLPILPQELKQAIGRSVYNSVDAAITERVGSVDLVSVERPTTRLEKQFAKLSQVSLSVGGRYLFVEQNLSSGSKIHYIVGQSNGIASNKSVRLDRLLLELETGQVVDLSSLLPSDYNLVLNLQGGYNATYPLKKQLEIIPFGNRKARELPDEVLNYIHEAYILHDIGHCWVNHIEALDRSEASASMLRLQMLFYMVGKALAANKIPSFNKLFRKAKEYLVSEERVPTAIALLIVRESKRVFNADIFPGKNSRDIMKVFETNLGGYELEFQGIPGRTFHSRWYKNE